MRLKPSILGVVALLAEGVDRNVNVLDPAKHKKVALLAEGVDRNVVGAAPGHTVDGSPSSRRAWIEIICQPMTVQPDSGRPPRGGRG